MPKAEIAAVASVSNEYTVVLNRGSSHGVEVGDRFLVYRIGDEIYDPATRKSLGKLEIVCGTGRITHVQENMSTLRSDQTTREQGKAFKRVRTGPGRSIFGGGEIIETVEGVKRPVPFEAVSVNDKAKRI